MAQRSIVEDVRRLSRRAAVIGVVLALVCQLLPEHYKVPCNAIAALCRGAGGSLP